MIENDSDEVNNKLINFVQIIDIVLADSFHQELLLTFKRKESNSGGCLKEKRRK